MLETRQKIERKRKIASMLGRRFIFSNDFNINSAENKAQGQMSHIGMGHLSVFKPNFVGKIKCRC